MAYQPSSIKAEKLEWLEKFEALMADIYFSWKGTLILTGHFNIDILNSCKGSTKRYRDIFHMRLLQQHVTNQERQNSYRSSLQ